MVLEAITDSSEHETYPACSSHNYQRPGCYVFLPKQPPTNLEEDKWCDELPYNVLPALHDRWESTQVADAILVQSSLILA
jgi:hypothetical protein